MWIKTPTLQIWAKMTTAPKFGQIDLGEIDIDENDIHLDSKVFHCKFTQSFCRSLVCIFVAKKELTQQN